MNDTSNLNRNRRLKSILSECNAPACEKVRALCVLLNLGSSTRLMRKTGRHRTHFYRVLKNPGESPPLVIEICARLGVEPGDLFRSERKAA